MAEEPAYIEKRNQAISAVVSVGFHTALILLMLYMTLSTPIPPYPEGGGGEGSGVEINLGTSETGLGNIQPEELNIPREDPPAPASSNAPEKLLTQDMEDDNAIEASPKKEVKKAKPNVNEAPVTKKPTQAVAEKQVEKKPVVNPNALYKPRTYSQGVAQGSGDQGKPGGSPTAPAYTGQGKGGDGSGEGAGGGTGGGIGSGKGKGIGPGVSYDLGGRSYLSLPKPEYNSQAEGVVVVEITVDKDGKVISANPGYKGSTTLNVNLMQLAREAALNARFEPLPGTQVQKGTITYRFRLQ